MGGGRPLPPDAYVLNGYPICDTCWPEPLELWTTLPHDDILSILHGRRRGWKELNIFDELQEDFQSFMSGYNPLDDVPLQLKRPYITKEFTQENMEVQKNVVTTAQSASSVAPAASAAVAAVTISRHYMTTQTDNIHPRDHHSSAHIDCILFRLSPVERHIKEVLHVNDTLSQQLETQQSQLATQQPLLDSYREHIDKFLPG